MSHASSDQPALKPAASQNPLSASEPWNLVADGYAETTMLVFEQFAEVAIAASKLKPNSTVLDVACSSPCFATKSNKRTPHIALHCGDAQTLPYADAID